MDRTLIVMRHAKSSWRTSEPDFRRPLSSRGRKDAAAAGRILAGYPVETLLSSSATRTRETWEAAASAGASCPDVRFTDALYNAWTDEVLAELGSIEPEVTTAMLLGHSPTMESVVSWLAESSELADRVAAHFPTGALAELAFDGDWDDLTRGQARVVRFEIPRG